MASLQDILPIIEKVLAGKHGESLGGTASSLGANPDDILGRLLKGGISGFGSQQALGGGLRKVADIKRQMAQAAAAMQAQQAHSASMVSGYEDPSSFYHSPEMGAQERASQAQSEQQHQQQMQAMQRQMLDLQARAASSLNPSGATAVSRVGALARFAPVAGAGLQLASYAGTAAGEGLSFAGGPGAGVIQQAGGQAKQGLANVGMGALAGAGTGFALGGPAGAVAGLAIGGLAASGAEIAKLPNKIVAWSEALVESQRTISRFNGNLTMMFAEQERRRIIRGIESGARTGGTSSELSNSLNRLYDTLQPAKDALTVLTSKTLTPFIDGMNTAMKHLDEIKMFLLITSPVFASGLEVLQQLYKLAEKEFEKNRTQGGAIAQSLWKDIQLHDVRKPREVPRR